MVNSQSLADIACLGRRIQGSGAMAAPTVALACPGVGCRRERNLFGPGLMRKHEALFDEIVLKEHPLRDELISF